MLVWNECYFIAELHFFQTLNDPEIDCRNPKHYCVAALKQKQRPTSVGDNLRNQLAKVIKLNYEVTYVWHRPNSYISKLNEKCNKIKSLNIV